ncbi:MAG: hypothetical protein ACE5H3_10525 [Planctomycetota bacterium]
MDKLLKKILENYEFIFWMIVLFGGGVVSWIKNRNQARQRQEKARQQAHRERMAKPSPAPPGGPAPVPPRLSPRVRPRAARPDLESVLASMGLLVDPAEEAGSARKAVPSLPLPVPELKPLTPRLEAAHLQPGVGGGLEALKDHEDLKEGRVLVSGFREYEPGRMTRTQTSAWAPPGDWRDAVILREVLGSPRAFAMEDLPGLAF